MGLLGLSWSCSILNLSRNCGLRAQYSEQRIQFYRGDAVAQSSFHCEDSSRHAEHQFLWQHFFLGAYHWNLWAQSRTLKKLWFLCHAKAL